jgi:hypothetical protein
MSSEYFSYVRWDVVLTRKERVKQAKKDNEDIKVASRLIQGESEEEVGCNEYRGFSDSDIEQGVPKKCYHKVRRWVSDENENNSRNQRQVHRRTNSSDTSKPQPKERKGEPRTGFLARLQATPTHGWKSIVSVINFARHQLETETT